MKRFQVLIFIFATLALLALLCSFFPAEGVKIKGISLNFPTIDEVLVGDEDAVEADDPQLVISQRRESLNSKYEDYFSSDPARFHFPEGSDESFFDELFSALESAEDKPVRVVHYGDSQIEEDRITSVIRDSLQKRFGGSGPGRVAAYKHYSLLIASKNSEEDAPLYTIYGEKADTNAYGPFGEILRMDSTASLSWSQVRKELSRQKPFERLVILAGNSAGFTAELAGQRRSISAESSAPMEYLEFSLPDSTYRASAEVDGKADIYGVLLDSRTGVRVDNVPMRGCSGLVFTGMDRNQLGGFYQSENVRLILLQYGGNGVPYMTSGKSISSYCTSIRRQLRRIKQLAPQATIVFIGPADMSTLEKGKRVTYSNLPMMVDSLKAAANAEGAAFWNMYEAMGGRNSMPKWVAADPALAGSDHIHFTVRGAEAIGDMFVDSFLFYYEYYLHRRESSDTP